MNPFLSKGGKGPGGPLGPKPPATDRAPIQTGHQCIQII